MFRENYKEAYLNIRPQAGSFEKILKKAASEKEKQNLMYRRPFVLHPIPAVLVALCMVFVLSLPVYAKSSGIIYRILVKYAPQLTEYILTEEVACSSQGIIMQVEKIEVDGKQAQIWISFSDEPGSNKINSRVDMYDSYSLRSYSGVSNVGGSGFGEYNAEEDKSYHKISVSTFDEFDMEFLQFKVRMLLTDIRNDVKEISLQNIEREPATRKVSVYSKGQAADIPEFQRFFGMSGKLIQKYTCNVLDMTARTISLKDELTVTGLAYENGVLRVQFCRGNQDAADRYLDLSLTDADGSVRHYDAKADWQEEIEGTKVMFEEHWFLVEEEDLDDVKLEGEFRVSAGAVYGNWEVNFKVEDYTAEHIAE